MHGRLARLSANLGSLKVIDIYRINDSLKTVKKWQGEPILHWNTWNTLLTFRSLPGDPYPARMMGGASPDRFVKIRGCWRDGLMPHLAPMRRMGVVA